MPSHVIKSEKVAQCLSVLRSKKVHRQFVGYLCIKRMAARVGTTRRLNVDFTEFFRTFLSAKGGPTNRPYIVIFTEESPSEHNRWFNQNVAGSYAPSSLRPEAPLRQVVDIEGRARATRYSLKPRHWQLARTHLAFGKQIPVMHLSVVLYRDFAIEKDTPVLEDLVTAFRDEFGYPLPTQATDQGEFELMYSLDEEILQSSDWFEPLET